MLRRPQDHHHVVVWQATGLNVLYQVYRTAICPCLSRRAHLIQFHNMFSAPVNMSSVAEMENGLFWCLVNICTAMRVIISIAILRFLQHFERIALGASAQPPKRSTNDCLLLMVAFELKVFCLMVMVVRHKAVFDLPDHISHYVPLHTQGLLFEVV